MSATRTEGRAPGGRRARRLVVGAVSVALSAGLVALLLARIDLGAALELLAGADRRWLLLAALLTCTMPASGVLRWRGVLRAVGARLPFAATLRAVLLSHALNAFLPSKAGEVAKAAYLRRRGGVSSGLGTVLVERLTDLAVLGALAVLGGLAGGTAWGWVGAALVGGVAGVYLLLALVPVARLPLPERVRGAAGDVQRVFRAWVRTPSAILQTLAGSLATWSAGGALVYALTRAFGADVPLPFVLAIFPSAILAGLVPLTISGIGTRDAAFAALLAGTASPEAATLVALGYTAFAYWLLSLIGLPGALWEAWLQARARRPDRELDPRPDPSG